MMQNIKKNTVIGMITLIATVASIGSAAHASLLTNRTVTASAMTAPGNITSHALEETDNDFTSPFLSSPSQDTEAALAFVRETGLNKNLSLMLLETMKKDITVLSAIESKGFKAVQRVVVNAIILERAEHEADWNKVLAGVYSKHFSTAELNSLARLKEKSPYFVRLISLQNEITAMINEAGSALLKTAERNVKNRVEAALGA